MGKNTIVPIKEREALREFAAYVAKLPPLEEWIEIKRQIDPQNAINTELYWQWLGKSLDAFFGDRSDPLEDSGLTETLQEVIQANSTNYILLSALIFQGEKFLKREAKAQGRNYYFIKRSDLLKELALEEYRYKTLLSCQDHWELHSERQRNERLRDTQKYLKGEISESMHTRQKERWNKENAKLQRDNTLIFRAMPWMNFCIEVFTKYQQKLPAYKAFVETLGIPKYGKVKKIVIINGFFREYPAPRRKKRE